MYNTFLTAKILKEMLFLILCNLGSAWLLEYKSMIEKIYDYYSKMYKDLLRKDIASHEFLEFVFLFYTINRPS